MCGGVQGIGGLRVLVGCGGTPGNRKHMPASHYLHYFNIIIQYDITIIPTIIFRGCESSWDAGGTPGNRKHMPASHYLHYFHIIIQYDMTIISTIIFRGCESSWDTGAPGNRKHMPTIFL